jgi:hypothetical protein
MVAEKWLFQQRCFARQRPSLGLLLVSYCADAAAGGFWGCRVGPGGLFKSPAGRRAPCSQPILLAFPLVVAKRGDGAPG